MPPWVIAINHTIETEMINIFFTEVVELVVKSIELDNEVLDPNQEIMEVNIENHFWEYIDGAIKTMALQNKMIADLRERAAMTELDDLICDLLSNLAQNYDFREKPKLH